MSIQTLAKAVELDLKVWGAEVEDALEGFGLKLWTAFKVITMSMAPVLFKEFQTLAVEGLSKITTTDLADIETFVLQGATADLKAAMGALGSQYVQALIAIVKAL